MQFKILRAKIAFLFLDLYTENLFWELSQINCKIHVNIFQSKVMTEVSFWYWKWFQTSVIVSTPQKIWNAPTIVLPVQAQSVWCEEQILWDIPACDVYQDVTCHHLGEGGASSDPTGAGEACPLHGADTTHRLMDGEGEGGRRRHRLWANIEESSLTQ